MKKHQIVGLGVIYRSGPSKTHDARQIVIASRVPPRPFGGLEARGLRGKGVWEPLGGFAGLLEARWLGDAVPWRCSGLEIWKLGGAVVWRLGGLES